MDKEQLMRKYRSGEIRQEDEQLLEQFIHDGIISMEELEEIDDLGDRLERLPVPEPTPELRSNVYQMIASERREVQESPFKGILDGISKLLSQPKYQVAYTIALLLAGVFGGRLLFPANQSEMAELSSQVKEMKEMMMINMLEDASASERLKAVQIGYEIGGKERVVEALLNTLNNDENVNVRLASLEALEQYAHIPEVREGLIQSIVHQDSPMVQVSLADLMVRLQDRQAAKDFKELLDQQEILPEVRQNIDKNLNQLI